MKKIAISKKTYERISFIYRIGGFFFILAVLSVYSLLINKVIEFILVFLPYFITKNFYSKQFHSKSLKECFLVSLVTFGVITLLTLSKNISIMFSVLFGLSLAFVSCKISDIQFKLKDYSFIEPRYNELFEFYNRYTSFDVKNCTKEELIERCKILGFNDRQIEFCVKAFIDKLSEIELMEYSGIELQSVKNKKMYYKKKLMK